MSASFLEDFSPRVTGSNCVEKHVLCGSVCGFMFFFEREHHFKTNSLQRKQSPLDHYKVSTSNVWAKRWNLKKKKKQVVVVLWEPCPMTYFTVGVTLAVPSDPSAIFEIGCVTFAVTLFLPGHADHQRGMEMWRAVSMVIRQKQFQS